MGVECISPSTYFAYQRHYLCPVISEYYTTKMGQYLQQYGHGEVVVSGDGRCDSPGKCAKFCTYTLMEISKNVILHCKTVDKREVHNKSPNMEREAIDRAVNYVKDQVNIVEITTDSFRAVTKVLADKHPTVLHIPWTYGIRLSC